MKKGIVHDYKNWSEIESAITRLVEKLAAKKLQFRTISTISRGGLVPARLMADRLGIKQILVDSESVPADSLFVDDIYDSGETFRKIIQRADDPDSMVFATIYARRKQNYPKQLVYAELTRDTEYIVYPWDRFEHGMPYEAH
ncbi:phosphoribosyltransferase [Candidatus Nitrosotenuis cloacae]|uniref:Phosphoribosyltransferase n=1 Tax=Candidatus Nitrosotenuis cloacae TaxID=1603555 RepID=A0A3G1B110_9ARCH|nr:phosphoribosyltransferase [Candidatus Nitrosotenuis cloacae]AJZ75813.1 phosphoribosyltransferase [Candidatus Nitrosotenuis cloacae]